MWTRSAANRITGMMTVVCTDWNGKEFYRGDFSSLADANEAGENAERAMTNAMNYGEPLDCNMTIDELLAEFAT